jgi:integrase/recombinase XerD
VTRLRKMMLEELQRRNYSESTIRGYLRTVAEFARHFGKSPDKLGPDDLRSYQAYLLQERKLTVGTVIARVAALRFFFVRTLKRQEFRQDLPYPKKQRRLPNVLSVEEVTRLINAAGNLTQRALLMILYGTGMRRKEVSLLKIGDIDSRRMIIRVERGKGGHDRDLPLSPALLETLREYWRWKKPQIYLFPSGERHRGKDQPISDKVVWYARLHGGGSSRRHHQARDSAHAETQLGHASAGGGHGSANDSDSARPRRLGDHGKVSAPLTETSARSD